MGCIASCCVFIPPFKRTRCGGCSCVMCPCRCCRECSTSKTSEELAAECTARVTIARENPWQPWCTPDEYFDRFNELSVEIENRKITTKCGMEIDTLYIPPPSAVADLPYQLGRFTLIYTHGNAGSMAGVLSKLIRMSRELGAAVYSFEYPGVRPWHSMHI